jgi:hypothetical protein
VSAGVTASATAFSPSAVGAFRFTGWSADWDAGAVDVRYALDDAHHFTESYRFPVFAERHLSDARRAALDRAARLLHLGAGVSYFKAAVPPRIEIEGAAPSPETAGFLGRLYTQGLGEFAWTNGLPEIGRGIAFPSRAGAGEPAAPAGLGPRSLVPVGGGKDSVVSLAALRAAGEELVAHSVGRKPSADAAAAAEGVAMLHVERRISPELFALNAAGALNGHVPITAIVSCVALVSALLEGCDAVVMSNERSASSGNFDWPAFGETINHQYSKGWEAERGLAEVVRREVAPDLAYFSLLRPYSELAISRAFAGLPAHHATFMSCNAGFRIHEPTVAGWCRDCPKCRFVFLALAPFMGRAELVAAMGGDMLDDPRQVDGYRAILGIDAEKPFECVGETDEARAAMRALAASPEWAGAAVVAALAARIGGPDASPLAAWLTPRGDHGIPERHRRAIGAFLGA